MLQFGVKGSRGPRWATRGRLRVIVVCAVVSMIPIAAAWATTQVTYWGPNVYLPKNYAPTTSGIANRTYNQGYHPCGYSEMTVGYLDASGNGTGPADWDTAGNCHNPVTTGIHTVFNAYGLCSNVAYYPTDTDIPGATCQTDKP